MGIAGYVSVCVQLYNVGFHCFTTCFGLHGHGFFFTFFYFFCVQNSRLLSMLYVTDAVKIKFTPTFSLPELSFSVNNVGTLPKLKHGFP
jgi:hypothetical protein